MDVLLPHRTGMICARRICMVFGTRFVEQTSPVRHDPDFQKLWFGQGVSTFGSLISRIAIPFLAVIELEAKHFEWRRWNRGATPRVPVGVQAGA